MKKKKKTHPLTFTVNGSGGRNEKKKEKLAGGRWEGGFEGGDFKRATCIFLHNWTYPVLLWRCDAPPTVRLNKRHK